MAESTIKPAGITRALEAPADWDTLFTTVPLGSVRFNTVTNADTATHAPTDSPYKYGILFTYKDSSAWNNLQVYVPASGNANSHRMYIRTGPSSSWDRFDRGGGLTTFREKGVRNADYGNIQGITIMVNASAQYQFLTGFLFSRQGLNSFRINTDANGVPQVSIEHIMGNDTITATRDGQTLNLKATTTWNDFGILYFGSIAESNLTFGAITA